MIGLSGIYYSLGEDSLSAHYKEVKNKLDANAALTVEEKAAFFEELDEGLEAWIQVVLLYYPDMTADEREKLLEQLRTSWKSTIQHKNDGGDTLFFPG